MHTEFINYFQLRFMVRQRNRLLTKMVVLLLSATFRISKSIYLSPVTGRMSSKMHAACMFSKSNIKYPTKNGKNGNFKLKLSSNGFFFEILSDKHICTAIILLKYYYYNFVEIHFTTNRYAKIMMMVKLIFTELSVRCVMKIKLLLDSSFLRYESQLQMVKVKDTVIWGQSEVKSESNRERPGIL